MKVEDCKHVSLRYKLSLESGEAVGSSREEEPLEFIVGTNQIIPGLERGILGMEQGQQARIRVDASDAYGEHRSDLIRDIPRENFPEDVELEVGMGFEASGPHAVRCSSASTRSTRRTSRPTSTTRWPGRRSTST